MEGDREKNENMARTTTARVLSREFTCYVRQKDDICYLLRFREDAKGQDVMDEVKYIIFSYFSLRVQSPTGTRRQVENVFRCNFSNC